MNSTSKRQRHAIDIKCTGCRYDPHNEDSDNGGYPCNGCNTRELLLQLDQTKAGMYEGNRYFTKEHQRRTLLEVPQCPWNNLTQTNVDDLMEFYELNR